MTFNKGDLVKLKSGGPTMTVTEVAEKPGGYVHCVWFDGKKKLDDSFDPESLKPAPRGSGFGTVNLRRG